MVISPVAVISSKTTEILRRVKNSRNTIYSTLTNTTVHMCKNYIYLTQETKNVEIWDHNIFRGLILSREWIKVEGE